jgi:flagellin-like hook-associated protein FlgL
MAGIGIVLSGFEQQLLRALAAARAQEDLHHLRLATGEKVSKPVHDPAAFVQISGLKVRLSQTNQAINQVDAAATLAAEAQLQVDLVRTQLETIREKLVEDEDGDLDAAERSANQAAIDTALGTINTLAGAEFTGGAAFDGGSDYRITGRNTAQVSRVDVHRSPGGLVAGSVTTAAQRAVLTYTGASGATTAAATITLEGETGSVAVSVSNGQTLASLATTINASSHKTGVIAEASGDTLTLRSVEYGSDAFAEVSVDSGTFAVAGGVDGRDIGSDAVAEINGRTITGDGNRVTYADNASNFTVEFAAGFSGSFTTMRIETETASRFVLSPEVAQTTQIGLRSLFTAELGRDSGRLSGLATGGSLAGLDSNTSQAIRVVDEALAQLDLVQATTDGFADITVATSSALLDGMKTNLENALTAINGVDEEEEDAYIDLYQALSSNAISALAISAQQRQSAVALLRSLAGLE